MRALGFRNKLGNENGANDLSLTSVRNGIPPAGTVIGGEKLRVSDCLRTQFDLL